jgi:hypothetical protein
MTTYDPRYLAGILLFNEQAYFEAHEVWEDLWADSHGTERKFVQGLIQAAVGLCHFGNGNHRGAVKLYHSSRDYLAPCGPTFWGLDVAGFLQRMQACFAPLLGETPPERSVRPDPGLLPVLTLDPSPAEWPDPEAFLPAEE